MKRLASSLSSRLCMKWYQEQIATKNKCRITQNKQQY
jgi:hypothetical protein